MEPTAGRPFVSIPLIYIVARTLIAPRRPLPRVISAALEAGADGVELPQAVVPMLMNPDDIEDLPQFNAPPVLDAMQPLFADSQVRHDALLTTVLQAHALGCRLVTFPLGDVSGLTSETLDSLRVTLNIAYTDAPGVQVAVANDRAPAMAGASVLPWLLDQAAEWEHPMRLTFDLDNWIAMGIDAVRAAKELGRYVVHIRVGQNALESSTLREELPLARVLELLPANAPRALVPDETTADHAQLVAVLQDSVNRLGE
jgi:sugar phosphate isomerase/epimerase